MIFRSRVLDDNGGTASIATDTTTQQTSQIGRMLPKKIIPSLHHPTFFQSLTLNSVRQHWCPHLLFLYNPHQKVNLKSVRLSGHFSGSATQSEYQYPGLHLFREIRPPATLRPTRPIPSLLRLPSETLDLYCSRHPLVPSALDLEYPSDGQVFSELPTCA